MAANIFKSGSSNAEVIFDRAVDYINLNVETSVTFAFSPDDIGYIKVPSGFYSFRIGATKKIYIQANGNWTLLAIQA
jgi:hypothetical protein